MQCIMFSFLLPALCFLINILKFVGLVLMWCHVGTQSRVSETNVVVVVQRPTNFHYDITYGLINEKVFFCYIYDSQRAEACCPANFIPPSFPRKTSDLRCMTPCTSTTCIQADAAPLGRRKISLWKIFCSISNFSVLRKKSRSWLFIYAEDGKMENCEKFPCEAVSASFKFMLVVHETLRAIENFLLIWFPHNALHGSGKFIMKIFMAARPVQASPSLPSSGRSCARIPFHGWIISNINMANGSFRSILIRAF